MRVATATRRARPVPLARRDLSSPAPAGGGPASGHSRVCPQMRGAIATRRARSVPLVLRDLPSTGEGPASGHTRVPADASRDRDETSTPHLPLPLALRDLPSPAPTGGGPASGHTCVCPQMRVAVSSIIEYLYGTNLLFTMSSQRNRIKFSAIRFELSIADVKDFKKN